MKKVIVTGSDGFIGKRLVSKLKEQDIEVLEYDKNTCWYLLTIFDEWNDIDCIYHIGAISDTTASDPLTINNYNVSFSISLFMIAAVKGIPVKYASSASVYGNASGLDLYNPLNFYAISKLTVDYWVRDHLDEFSLIQGFRFFNVYGDGEEDKVKRNQSSPISKFIEQAKTTGKIQIFEETDVALRDFICVDDVVDVLINNEKGSGIYDLGSSEPISFRQVAEAVADSYDAEVEEIPFPEHLKGKYQTYTRAKDEGWGVKFITVEDYVKNSVG